jgi:hypothetical protein
MRSEERRPSLSTCDTSCVTILGKIVTQFSVTQKKFFFLAVDFGLELEKGTLRRLQQWEIVTQFSKKIFEKIFSLVSERGGPDMHEDVFFTEIGGLVPKNGPKCSRAQNCDTICDTSRGPKIVTQFF